MVQDILDLERRLCCVPQLEELESLFNGNSDKCERTESFLRSVKSFLSRRKKERYAIFNGTMLRGSDCLTMAILGADLAYRKGYDVKIVRPTEIIHYCHAALSYDGGVFKITGSRPVQSYTIMSNDDIIWRLRITKPIVDFVNQHIRQVY